MRSGLVLGVVIGAMGIAALAFESQRAPAPAPIEPPLVREAPHGAAGEALPPGHPPIDGGAPIEGGLGPVDPDAKLPPGHPPIDGATPHGHGATAEAEAAPTRVPRVPGGLTVSEIFASGPEREGKSVLLSAKIVKVTPNVLGRTWLHVQDGTGDASRGDHDLVATTEAPARVGDLAVLECTLVRNKDLGSGYHYDVLLEDCRLTPLGAERDEPQR